MKLKVSLFDRKILKNFLELLSIISLICSFLFIVITIPECYKIYFGIGFLILLLVIYITICFLANNKNSVILDINNSKLVIKIGNLFEEEGLRVIAFNEYLDTIVDNKLIVENTINSHFINKIIDDVNELDKIIESDENLTRNIIDTNENKLHGKKKKYKLGSVFLYKEFLLTAFSKIDIENRSYLNMKDYVNFLMNFWNEIDIIYAGRSISIPLLGSGITRFKGFNNLTEQELLEVIIWTFKLSRVKISHPAEVTIVIHESKKDKINLYNFVNQ